MKLILLLIVALVISIVVASPADLDVGKDMVQIVQERGYQIETHYVTTKDGYILTLFNIPHNKQSTKIGKPVILQHGLLDSSYTWVNNFQDESLGYILSDNGFDVWFGNNRGNRYGRNHTTLNPDEGSSAFWKFTWDEMASIDVPSMINYITDYRNSSSISWVGHSEGTCQVFGAGTLVAKNSFVKNALAKVDLFVATGPAAYVTNVESQLFRGLAETRLVSALIHEGVYEFLPYRGILAPKVCQATPAACNLILEAVGGPTQNLNQTRLQVYVSETPAGTSIFNMDHWAQGILSEDFKMYDYGNEVENMKAYGQKTPPLYVLGDYQGPPIAFFSGSNDWLADPVDVQRLINELPADKIVFQDVQSDFAHLDFTWAFNANTRIYNKITDLLKQYSSK